MKLTQEEFAALAPYEERMSTALYSRWSRNPGRRALEVMADIWRKHSYPGFRMDFNCSTCIVNLLSDVGRLYFADKAEKEAAAKTEAEKPAEEKPAAPKKVGTTDKAKTVKKKTIKTASK